MPDALFNIARFLLIKTENIQIEGVSRFIIIYTLLKQANFLGANKLSMQLLERLRKIKIPINQCSQLEISNLNARASSYKDPEELLPLCYKCSTFNPLLSSNNQGKCVQCGLKFQYSFVMFGKYYLMCMYVCDLFFYLLKILIIISL